MESLDDEATKMKMKVIGETDLKHFACYLIQILSPCPTSLNFFFSIDFSEFYCSYFRVSPNPFWARTSRELIIR